MCLLLYRLYHLMSQHCNVPVSNQAQLSLTTASRCSCYSLFCRDVACFPQTSLPKIYLHKCVHMGKNSPDTHNRFYSCDHNLCCETLGMQQDCHFPRTGDSERKRWIWRCTMNTDKGEVFRISMRWGSWWGLGPKLCIPSERKRWIWTALQTPTKFSHSSLAPPSGKLVTITPDGAVCKEWSGVAFKVNVKEVICLGFTWADAGTSP